MFKLCVAFAILAVAAAKPNWPLTYTEGINYPASSVYSYPYANNVAYTAPVLKTVAAPVVAKSAAVVGYPAPVVSAPLVRNYVTPAVTAYSAGVAPVTAYTSGVAPVARYTAEVAPVTTYSARVTPVATTYSAGVAPVATYATGVAPVATTYSAVAPVATNYAAGVVPFAPVSYSAHVAPYSFVLKKK